MRAVASEENHPEIDDIDKAIIRHLQGDGRMPYAVLGPLVGLSPAATRQRVLNLIEGGVMQIVAVTDPTKLGFGIQAMIGFRVTGDIEAVSSRLAAMDEVEYLVITTGRFDLLAEIVATSPDHFLGTLTVIRALSGVQTTEVFTYLRLEKQIYDWGTL